jgi:hypothetical protein
LLFYFLRNSSMTKISYVNRDYENTHISLLGRGEEMNGLNCGEH